MTTTSEKQVPTTPQAITPEWLTAALRAVGTIGADTTVISVKHDQIAEGVGFMSCLHRLHLEVDGEGPATLVAKLPTDTAYLQFAQMTGAYEREVRFYADVAPFSPLRTATAHVADIVPGSTDFVLIMDDLADLDGGDHVAGLTLERVERVIDELASFHAWAWGLEPPAAKSPTFPSIVDPVTASLYTMGVASGWATHEAHGRVSAPDGVADLVQHWENRLPAMLAAVAQPATLLNGDLRADNLFFTDDGSPVTVDFQLVMSGAGIWDVAYLVGQGVTPQERAGRERELVQRYVDGLARAGVTDYGFEEAWQQFRVSVVAQLTFPLTAMLSWDKLNDRARELLHALMERAYAIINDTHAIAALSG